MCSCRLGGEAQLIKIKNDNEVWCAGTAINHCGYGVVRVRSMCASRSRLIAGNGLFVCSVSPADTHYGVCGRDEGAGAGGAAVLVFHTPPPPPLPPPHRAATIEIC